MLEILGLIILLCTLTILFSHAVIFTLSRVVRLEDTCNPYFLWWVSFVPCANVLFSVVAVALCCFHPVIQTAKTDFPGKVLTMYKSFILKDSDIC